MAILDTLKNAVSEFIRGRKSGPFAPEVEAIRDGPEAKAARAKRETATTVWAVAEDDEVRLAGRTSAVVAQQLAEARPLASHLAGMASNDPDLSAAQQLVGDLEKAAGVGAAWSAAAEGATLAWIHQTRRAGLIQLDTEYGKSLEQAATLARAREAYAAETSRLAGARDPQDPGHPFPLLLTHGEALARVACWWTPPPAPGPPRPAGYVRVKVKTRFLDLAGGWHFSDYCGQALGPEDLPDADVAEALRQGWVELVEA
jgi:hypothetical protein